MRFSDHRRQYTLGGLRRADLAEEPVAQFVAWQEQAIAAGLADPTACVLATQQPDQRLRQRMVLMKGVDAHGLVFYTCLLYTSPSPRDVEESRMPSSA